jgi:hypothetical protein
VFQEIHWGTKIAAKKVYIGEFNLPHPSLKLVLLC